MKRSFVEADPEGHISLLTPADPVGDRIATMAPRTYRYQDLKEGRCLGCGQMVEPDPKKPAICANCATAYV